MSRASKVFLASSFAITGATVWGVHYLQRRESDTMYQGVLRDEQRLRDKALALLPSSLTPSSLTPSPSPSPSHSSPSTSHSATPSTSHSATHPPTQSHASDHPPITSTGHTSSTPLNTPSSPVQQPLPVIDPECETCVISPPPQLLEAQSREERARERRAREEEYVRQRGLGERLSEEQGDGGGLAGKPALQARLV